MLIETLNFSKCQGQYFHQNQKLLGIPHLSIQTLNSPKQLPRTVGKFVMPSLSVLRVQWVDWPTVLIVKRSSLFMSTK